MYQLNHILAATDLSAPARHAVERAALVCKEKAATLDLLHVANLAPLERLGQLMGTTAGDLEDKVLQAEQTRLMALATELQRRVGITPATQVVAGDLLTELAKSADALATDLLVCGAKGDSVFRRFALGTTALRMLGKTKCPVLVVKQPPRGAYKRLLVPVDFSSASLRALHHARCLAPQADMVLMHAFEVPFEGLLRYARVNEDTIQQHRVTARREALHKLQTLRDKAGLNNMNTSLLVLHGDPALRILEQEQALDCDLTAMGRHGDSLLEEMLLGSVTKHVLAELQGDLLVSV
ncbi:universal stress protein [Rhodoferax sp. U11-2br]|uniref:universal stress protein n=1 Tax=Rhodoferax sp. U11-2br TaxID=2838878 RepID=UPI001BEB728F|nr:universal stress protein [Rhodoferax sp. U11-2br]MBT3067886.1 universal stress protein [Rhodoferax sp. U11-2br]